MKEDVEKWTYDEFLVFLLMYAAAADFTISEEEKKMMTDKIGDGRYHQMLQFFEGQSDYESLQTILYFKDRYFPRPEDRDKLLLDMKKLLLSDRDVSLLEQNMLLVIRKLL